MKIRMHGTTVFFLNPGAFEGSWPACCHQSDFWFGDFWGILSVLSCICLHFLHSKTSLRHKRSIDWFCGKHLCGEHLSHIPVASRCINMHQPFESISILMNLTPGDFSTSGDRFVLGSPRFFQRRRSTNRLEDVGAAWPSKGRCQAGMLVEQIQHVQKKVFKRIMKTYENIPYECGWTRQYESYLTIVDPHWDGSGDSL